MAFKFLVVLIFVAVANAGILPGHQHELPLEHHPAVYHSPSVTHVSQPVLLQKHHPHHQEYPDDPHPQYNFAYDVQDAVSGDSKSQTESRDGDVVHGEYSLNDADGFRRTVKYTADPVNGFNAVVQREPLTHKVIAAAAPAQYYQAPAVVAKAPVAYAAPAYHEHQLHAPQPQQQHVAYEVAQHDDHHYYHH